MQEYYNPVVALEEERKPKVEKPEESYEDRLNEMFAFPDLCVGLICDLPDLGMSNEDVESDDDEEGASHFRTPSEPRGFLFLPSWHKVYYDLKEDDPERAFRYLERLIDFGVLGLEPPRTSSEDRLVYSLLDGAMNVIDDKYASYIRKIDGDRKKKEAAAARKRAEAAEKRKKEKADRRRNRRG